MNAQITTPYVYDLNEDSAVDDVDEAPLSLEPGRLYEMLVSDAQTLAFKGRLREALSKLEQAARFVDQNQLHSESFHGTFEDVVYNAYDMYFMYDRFNSTDDLREEIVDARCSIAKLFGWNIPSGMQKRIAAAYAILHTRARHPYEELNSQPPESLREDFIKAPSVPKSHSHIREIYTPNEETLAFKY
ncbi:hypothetical protein HY772_08365 [Candidatus Woesearchaeota archaeon]|nr:hypothetical protein [Candidatus Woesearchaeota archaeon]